MRELTRVDLDGQAFARKFGPWCVIAGASEGTGASFAEELASFGLNLVLVSRRMAALEELGSRLAEQHGISYRAVVQDLSAPGAGRAIVEAAAGLDVGLYIANAGADNFASFFEDDVEPAHQLVGLNVSTLIDAAHGFGRRFLKRGSGGIIVMSSGAGLGGQPHLAMYAATKGFQLNFAESLWAEYHERGIDVIAVAAPTMATPTLKRIVSAGFDLSTAFDPADVTHNALAGLLAGQPIQIFADGPEQDTQSQVEASRKDRLVGLAEYSKTFVAV